MSSRIVRTWVVMALILGTGRLSRAAAPEPPASEVAAVRDAVPPGAETVGLVVVGAPGPTETAVRNALSRALHAQGHRVVLLGGEPGHTVETPSEETLADLSRAVHLDVVVVVRLLTVPDGVTLRAQVRDASGVLLGDRQPSAAPAVAPVAPPAPVGPPDARLRALGQELYDREALSVSSEGAYQGRPPRAMEGAAFYTTVGRPDLAERYTERQHSKSAALTVGGIAAGVGVLWGLLDLAVKATATVTLAIPCALTEAGGGHDDACSPSASPVPWVVAGLGVGTLMVGAALPSDPVSPEERRALADRHNDALRARLGLPALARPTVKAAPFVTPQGGGLSVFGTF